MKNAPAWSLSDIVATLRNVASDLEAIAAEMEEGDGNLSSAELNSRWADAQLACEYINEAGDPHL